MCNCLCNANHPFKRGVCTGKQEVFVDFQNRETKRITTVVMCRPCRTAMTGDWKEVRYEE